MRLALWDLCSEEKSVWTGKIIQSSPEAEFLEEIQTKVLRVFLLAIHRPLNSFALRFLFLQTYVTSYSFYSSVTTKKGGKPTITLSLWFKKSIQKPQVWERSRLYARNLNEIVCSWIRLLQKSLKSLMDMKASRKKVWALKSSSSLESYLQGVDWKFLLIWKTGILLCRFLSNVMHDRCRIVPV
jgi:hypothetical protein